MPERDRYDWQEAMEKECSALNRTFSKGDLSGLHRAFLYTLILE